MRRVQGRIAKQERSLRRGYTAAKQSEDTRLRIVHALRHRQFAQRLYAMLCVRGYFPERIDDLRKFIAHNELDIELERLRDMVKGSVFVRDCPVGNLSKALRVPRLALAHGLDDYRELLSFMTDFQSELRHSSSWE